MRLVLRDLISTFVANVFYLIDSIKNVSHPPTMSYNMSDPEEFALAMDRLAAGIGPTLGPQNKLRKLRRDRAGLFRITSAARTLTRFLFLFCSAADASATEISRCSGTNSRVAPSPRSTNVYGG